MPLIQSLEKLIRLTIYVSVACLALSLLSLFFIDQNLATYFSSPANMELWNKMRAITDIGLGAHYFGFAIISLLFIYFGLRHFPSLTKYHGFFVQLKIWCWNLLAALTVSGLFLRLAKYFFGRMRPNKTPHHDPFIFSPFNLNWDYQSFPSGHSQVLFCVATSISVIDPKRTWLWFSLAAVFAFTRVGTYAHFLSDILAGASLGFLGALWAMRWMQKYSRFKLG